AGKCAPLNVLPEDTRPQVSPRLIKSGPRTRSSLPMTQVTMIRSLLPCLIRSSDRLRSSTESHPPEPGWCGLRVNNYHSHPSPLRLGLSTRPPVAPSG